MSWVEGQAALETTLKRAELLWDIALRRQKQALEKVS